jgi:HPt (histidine-containing phosphotransfer) domain-containing protein
VNLKANIDAAIEGLRSLESPSNPDFVKKVVEVFLADSPLLIEQSLESLAQGDLTTTARCAHSLKSTLATMGIENAAGIAMKVEKAAKEEHQGGLRDLLLQLKSEFESTIPYLSQFTK